MTIADTVEAYAAEKQLRDFSKLPISEQKRIRAERKKKKKERLAILAKISELQTQLCDKCRGKQNVIYCDCVASKTIQDLGKRLGGEVVIGRPKRTPMDDFRHITPETFNKQVYLDMKDAELTDRNVLSL